MMLGMSDVLTLPPVSSRRTPTLTVGAAARITGYHPATIRRALLRGDLEGYRAGTRGMYRIPTSALHDWIRPAHEHQETR
jgi:excisionase family DNA binding protein